MARCQVGGWDRDAVGNVAQPHARRDGQNVVTGADGATIPNVPMMAAGGIRCSLRDMLTWVTMWLRPGESGLVDGKPWLSAEQREAVWSPQTIIDRKDVVEGRGVEVRVVRVGRRIINTKNNHKYNSRQLNI